jgi:hypothetical protein
MNQIQLGQTDLVVSEVGFGAIPIIRLDPQVAARVLRHAYDRGITFFDTANAYRDSEEKIGQALGDVRERIVLATKTQQRSGDGLREHLERSLRMLRTDHIDLYQLHQIAQEADWEAVTAPGGALEEAVRARDAGKIRYLGVTSHSLSMALKVIRTGLFSTVQFPFNFIEEAAADELLPAARKLGMGFIVMKPFGGGAIDNAEAAFKYLRQHYGIVPIPGFESDRRGPHLLPVPQPGYGAGSGRHGALPCGAGQTLLSALRILPALPAGGHDYPSHGVPDPG